GDGFDPVSVHSMYMGCVGFTEQFFGDGKISRKRMKHAKLAAGLELQPVEKKLRKAGWDRAIGASGTIRSVASILSESGWAHGTITAEGLDKLEQAMLTTSTRCGSRPPRYVKACCTTCSAASKMKTPAIAPSPCCAIDTRSTRLTPIACRPPRWACLVKSSTTGSCDRMTRSTPCHGQRNSMRSALP
ncbi:MAG: hypothetical protein JRG70_14475, partial [Deltaproteobacteria bacterium]|nr:hypothetical protein [Deltaproteobacteria bacterium]